MPIPDRRRVAKIVRENKIKRKYALKEKTTFGYAEMKERRRGPLRIYSWHVSAEKKRGPIPFRIEKKGQKRTQEKIMESREPKPVGQGQRRGRSLTALSEGNCLDKFRSYY